MAHSKQCKAPTLATFIHRPTRQLHLIVSSSSSRLKLYVLLHMILSSTTHRHNSGMPRTDNENPPLPPKHEVNQLSHFDLKRRATHPDVLPSKRVPLDPLSASDLENRRNRNARSTNLQSYHSLVTPSSPSDVRVLLPERPVSSAPCGMQRHGTSGELVCSWPPPIPTPGTGRSSPISLAGPPDASSHCPLHSSDEKSASRADFLEPTFTVSPASSPPFHSDPTTTTTTTTMTKPIRTAGWKSENVLQPIRTRTNTLPSVRRPPRELWRSDSGLTKVTHEPVDVADLLLHSAPPGLPPRRSELRRSSSVSDLLPSGSISLSLALGSQPLRASEPTKAVPPIGAERSRVVSITSLKSHIPNPPVIRSDKPRRSPWRRSPLLPGSPKWEDEVEGSADDASPSQGDLERLLRHAVRNKYAPKIISPLSPLRTATSAYNLSTDPAYQLRVMPTLSNYPSPRYSRCPPRRARTICDAHQSLDWDSTCIHCQECKRDTVGKRLLAFRFRQRHEQEFSRQVQLQRHKLVHSHPPFRALPLTSSSLMVDDGDRIALAGRIREAFAYEMDEEEKTLWEDLAAVTGVGPVFSRAGVPCAVGATPPRRSPDGRSEDVVYDDFVEISEEGLLASRAGTLFRDVSVY